MAHDAHTKAGIELAQQGKPNPPQGGMSDTQYKETIAAAERERQRIAAQQGKK
jgi:hypothetical protein